MEKIYNIFKEDVETLETWNFTVTYDPKSITLKQSWDIRFEEILEVIKESCSRPDSYIMCKERMKNHYCHIHGQVLYRDTKLLHREVAEVRRNLRSRYGRCSFIHNISSADEKEISKSLGIELKETNKRDYTEYILKDVPQNLEKIKDYVILQYKYGYSVTKKFGGN